MADFCTCGTELPPNARFCHICGKPQREEDVQPPELTFVPPPLPPPIAPPPLALNFHNGVAVRIALLAAFVSVFLSVLVPIPAVAPTVGGFFAVYLYRRRTGQPVSVLGGARMGWITGLILFVIMASMLILVLMLIANYPGGANGLAAQMRNSPLPVQKEMIDQLAQFVQDPTKAILLLLDAFLLINVSTITGGVIGGKLVGKG